MRVMRVWHWLVALAALLFGRRRRRRVAEAEQEPIVAPDKPQPGAEQGRIVPAGTPQRRAETVVLILLGIAAAWAVGFVVVYAAFSPEDLPNELLGVCLAMSLAFVAAALTVVAKRLVVTEEL